MRILVVSQYFWPENFKINDLCLGLIERGHEVTVLTGIPNYPKGQFLKGYSFWKNNDEEWKGIKIYRSKLFPRGNGGLRLMLNYLSFVFFGTIKSFFIKEVFDKILVFEPSPITVGIPAIFISKRKKIPYYFWVQDLWPESIEAAGGIKNRLVLSFFDKITRLIYNRSKKVLVQSKGFIEYIVNQGVPNDKIIYYPNSTESFYKPLKTSKKYLDLLPSDGFKIMFAGNLGEAQSINTLIQAAKIVKEKNKEIHWVFLGDGRQKQNILNEVLINDLADNIHLLGSYPSECMPDFFACADALVVSLKKNKIFALTIPSKVQSYMACGKPILACLEGEGAKVIAESDSGLISEPENANHLADNILKMFNMANQERDKMGLNAFEYFQKEFERELLLDRLLEILNGES
jgi:glycosyltransferase involved in cell wall biosynthesis